MKKLLLTFLCAGLAIWSCSSGDKVSGVSTVETENAFLIKVVGTDSLPAINVLARMRLSSYMQEEKGTSTGVLAEYRTDSLGRIFVTDSVAKIFGSNSAAIEIIDGSVGAFAVVKFETDEKDTDSNLVTTMSLEKLGSLKGRIVFLADSAAVQPSKILVRINGTDRLVEADEDGSFVIDSLPAFDEYNLQFESSRFNVWMKAAVIAGETNDMGLLQERSIGYSVDELISDWMESAVAARKNGEAVVGFIRLDSTNFNFADVLKGGADVTMNWNADSDTRYFIDYWNDSLKKARIQVRFPADADSVTLWWSGISLSADGENLFENNFTEESIWKDVSSEVLAEQNSITLIDFENGMNSGLKYPALTNEWFLAWQGDSVISSTPVPDSAANGLESAGANREGTAFHWKSEAKNGSWSYVGLWISEPEKYTDLSALDSVEFYIRGKGSYSLSFESQGEGSLKGKALYKGEIDSEEWERIAVKPSDFIEGDSAWANLGWDMVRHQVTNINISAYREAELWIDDIKVYGVNLDDLK